MFVGVHRQAAQPGCLHHHAPFPFEKAKEPMEYLDYRSADGADPHAVLAATLCMMSCSMQSGCRIYLPRIAENLDWLSAAGAFDQNFRTLCRRLAAHWEAEVSADEVAKRAAESDGSLVHAMFARWKRLH
jgi:hypothetical protein